MSQRSVMPFHLKTNDAARGALADGSLDVVGGTAWLWAREDVAESVDVLFIDEAGQMSLADALAASLCCGEPRAPWRPAAARSAATGYASAGSRTLSPGARAGWGTRDVPGQFGLFLDGSWRLHPEISTYTSEVFYEGRLALAPRP